MHLKKFYILITIILFSVCFASAQNRRVPRFTPTDSLVMNRTVDPFLVPDTESTERFYDSLKTKTSRRGFTNLLYKSFFRRQRDTTYTGRIIDETQYFSRYEGREINSIILDREDVFEDADRGVQKLMNSVHVMTRRKVIRRDLLFQPGDKVDPLQMVRNKQIILYRPYIASVDFRIVPYESDTTKVDIYIYTEDKWSIGVDAKLLSRGRSMVELYDENFLGTGNRVTIHTSFDSKGPKYEGNGIGYEIPNIMGTFYDADMYVGKYYFDDMIHLGIRKEFINPSDYDVGFIFNKADKRYYMLYADSTDRVKDITIDVWAGKSLYLPRWKSSIYFTGRYSGADFRRRPESTGPHFNPAFHNYHMAILSAGLYKERFYAANMIYGYGFQEYLASGYKVEATYGYRWGEFHNDYYYGLSAHKGGLHNFGYLRADVDFGTFVDYDTGKLRQTTLDLEARWFSNLFSFRRTKMRQFIVLSHTRGWNRDGGADEVVKFTKLNGPKSIKEWLVGTNRSLLRTETVFFTPYKPLGFRVAMFGWADFSTLGYDKNIFRNDFYSTFGFGVRLKNERLTFSAIEIRLGVALGRGGLIKHDWIRASSEQRVMSERFAPSYPRITPFE